MYSPTISCLLAFTCNCNTNRTHWRCSSRAYINHERADTGSLVPLILRPTNWAVELEKTPGSLFDMVLPGAIDSSQIAAGELVAAMPPFNSIPVTAGNIPPQTEEPDFANEKSPPPGHASKDILDISSDEKGSRSDIDDYSEDVKLVNGQPVIETVSDELELLIICLPYPITGRAC